MGWRLFLQNNICFSIESASWVNNNSYLNWGSHIFAQFHWFYFFYWIIVNFQCFCCTEKWFSYIHTTFFLKYSYPLWFIIGYWISFSVLYSGTLFIHSVYKSLLLLNPISQSTPPPTPYPLLTTSLFSVSVILFLLHR